MDAQVAAGPVGRDAGAGVGFSTQALAPVLAYSHSKGITCIHFFFVLKSIVWHTKKHTKDDYCNQHQKTQTKNKVFMQEYR